MYTRIVVAPAIFLWGGGRLFGMGGRVSPCSPPSVCFTFSGDTLLQHADGPRMKGSVQVTYIVCSTRCDILLPFFLVCFLCFGSVVHLLPCFLNVAEDVIIQTYQWYSVGSMNKLVRWSDNRLCYLWHSWYESSEYFSIAFQCYKPPYDASRVCMCCVWYNVFLTSLQSLHCSIWSLGRKRLIDLIGWCTMSWYDLWACDQGWIPS